MQEAISRAHREEWARVVASLARRFGDLDIAEEAAAEAFAAAVGRWPADAYPQPRRLADHHRQTPRIRPDCGKIPASPLTFHRVSVGPASS